MTKPTRTTGVSPIRSLMFVLACACGGPSAGHDAGAGSAPDSGSPVSTSSPSSMPAAPATDGPAGSSDPSGGSAPPFGSSAAPGSAPETDASCTPGVLPSAPPGSALDACWTCMTRGCTAQLAKCVSDCACNAAIGDMLAQMNSGGQVRACVVPVLGGAGFCLSQACLECGCSGVIVPDAGIGADGGNCAPVGGGGSFGNGQCSSTLSETCNGTNYQIICSCPDAKCACFGPTSQIVAYSGCPYCPSPGGPVGPSGPPPSDLLAQCGFPH